MRMKNLFSATTLATLALLTFSAGGFAAEPAKEGSKKNADQAAPPELKLPPGWTAEDLQAFIVASTPGKEQKHLADDAGVWHGKTTMWMGPGGEAVESECKSTISPIMGGRYTRCEMTGDFPGMGPYKGIGLYGFDNVTGQFVSTWIDNHSTGIMSGVGKLSDDGKTLTWTYTHSCPLTKKPTVMREIETTIDADHKTLEMHGADPKTGKEYKMMRVELTRQKK